MQRQTKTQSHTPQAVAQIVDLATYRQRHLTNLLGIHRVTLSEKVQALFERRKYSRAELERAVKRFKIFKDLGYGDRQEKSR
jgi:hypothetical protein